MINKTRLITLTKKVISINSENPPGNELKLAEFIEKDMQALHLDVKRYSFVKNRPNIVIVYKGSCPREKAKKNAILITPHLDTVPIGTGWTFDPFGGKIHRGRIYGRGATDDKGNLACCMELMHSLKEDEIKLKRDVIFAATVDEETGSHYGIIPLLARKIIRPKTALILDADECDTIIAQKGLIHARIQIFGKKAHGAYNWRGVNAIETAAKIIEKVKKHKFKYKRHALLRPPSINIGVIKGGDKVNMVADFCEFAIDIRFLPSMDARKVLKAIRNIVESETKKFKVIVDDLQQPYEIPSQHPFVRTYVRCAKTLGIKTTLKGSEGATVMTFFRKHRIPAFATGYGSHGTAHTTDEYVKIDVLYRGAKLLEKFLKDYDQH